MVPQKILGACNEEMELSMRTEALEPNSNPASHGNLHSPASKLELGESLAMYNPQRVLRQFGYD